MALLRDHPSQPPDPKRVDALAPADREAMVLFVNALQLAVDNVRYQRELGLIANVSSGAQIVVDFYPLMQAVGVNIRPSVKEAYESADVTR